MTDSASDRLRIRGLTRTDLPEAADIMRLAFGTFLGLPEPLAFGGGREMVEARWTIDPSAAFAAVLDGRLVGSNFVANWGSVGFFGPLSVHPAQWDGGIAQRLLEPTMDCFSRWQTRHAGLYTFAQSTKHLHLYQRFGFWPRCLTSLLWKPVASPASVRPGIRLSQTPAPAAASLVRDCGLLTDAVYEGLDLGREIYATRALGLGDTVLIDGVSGLSALAVCHWGPGSEAEPDELYIKFAAAHPGHAPAAVLTRLLDACEHLAAAEGLQRLVAGVNTARHQAYRLLLARGFRARLQGVTMHRPNEAGYDREDVFLLDDWR